MSRDLNGTFARNMQHIEHCKFAMFKDAFIPRPCNINVGAITGNKDVAISPAGSISYHYVTIL